VAHPFAAARWCILTVKEDDHDAVPDLVCRPMLAAYE
jgi:hypothetical protein